MGDRPTLAVVGATGAVGSVALQLLSQHADVWGEIRLLGAAPGRVEAGRIDAGRIEAGRVPAEGEGEGDSALVVRGEATPVTPLTRSAFDGVDVALFLVPDEVSAQWAPVAVEQGAVVVDRSAAFRLDPDVPLVVPELNPEAVRVRPRSILASPGCATLSMIVAVGALDGAFGLRELVVSSYQAASAVDGLDGVDQGGVFALREQLSLVAGTDLGTRPGDVRRAVGDATGPFPAPLALNVVPWTGPLQGQRDGWSAEELAIRAETRKVLGRPELRIVATCVQVPVITAHSMSVHACFEQEVTVERAHEVLATSPGVVLFDDPEAGEFPTPADVVGTDPTWVGRVRRSPDDPRALELFVCGDDLRKGGALNAVQIAEAVAAELSGPTGPAGPAGPAGPSGPAGP